MKILQNFNNIIWTKYIRKGYTEVSNVQMKYYF
jgi:hypothetical protein